MKNNSTIIRLSLITLPLALIAATVGVFWQGVGDSYPFQTLMFSLCFL